MTLQQLRFLIAVRDNGLNITAAARALNTSQPGVSRQLQTLEKELGMLLFEREGRGLTRPTSLGVDVIARADLVLREVQNIRRTSADHRRDDTGLLSLATTHTQARYVLPTVVERFRQKYPKVRIHIEQGSSEQIADMMTRSAVDLAIATGSEDQFPSIIRLPIYRWHRAVVVPKGHPLTEAGKLTLSKIAEYPIITYEFSLDPRTSNLAPFERAGLTLDVALAAHDADVIKTYVRLGLGVAILAPFAVDPVEDPDLVVLDASHLFSPHTSWIGFKHGLFLRSFIYDFIEQLAPHLPKSCVREAEKLSPAQVRKVSASSFKAPERLYGAARHSVPVGANGHG
jgi:LysR family transcriptional regulator, cys regulon transcriptional activator